MAKYTPQELQELYYIARNIIWRYRLDQYEEEVLAGVLGVLKTAEREAVAALSSVDIKSLDPERQRRILVVIDRLTLGARQQMTQDIAEATAEAGRYSLAAHASILSLDGRVVPFNNIALSPEQFRKLMVEMPLGGKLLGEWVDAALSDAVRDQLRVGAIFGEGYPSLVERITDGFGLARTQAITISRTYIQSANVAAQMATYQANADIVKGWKWCATLEPGYKSTGRGTCLRCAALDGQQFDLGEGPDIPLHPRCRCVATPVTMTYRELGIDIDEMEDVARPYTMRPDKNIDEGLRRTIEEAGFHQGDYGTWFAKQGRAFQLNAVGPERYELLQSGKVTFGQLVDSNTGRLRTIDELRGQ